MPEIQIADRFSPPQTYEGTLIGKSSSRRGERALSWVDMFVYRLDDGDVLVHRVGMSRIYHTARTACITFSGRQRGEPAGVEDLPDDAVPCTKCRPRDPWRLGDDEKIRFEFPRHTVDRCPDALAAIRKLTEMQDRTTKVRTVTVSEPVRELLGECAGNDAQFADAVGERAEDLSA